jgi:hypothetical protein
MARYGRVTFSISYVVDLDDAEMIDEAMEMVQEDVRDSVRHDGVSVCLETEPDGLSEDDIHDYLIEQREERLCPRS